MTRFLEMEDGVRLGGERLVHVPAPATLGFSSPSFRGRACRSRFPPLLFNTRAKWASAGARPPGRWRRPWCVCCREGALSREFSKTCPRACRVSPSTAPATRPRPPPRPAPCTAHPRWWTPLMSPFAAFRNGGLRAGAHRTRTGVSFFLVARLPRTERALSLTPHTPPLSLFLSSQLVALLRPASATADLLLKLDKVRASVSGREREMVGAERGARGAHEKPGRAQKNKKTRLDPPPFPLSPSLLSPSAGAHRTSRTWPPRSPSRTRWTRR